ncbi:GNAT family N-acetyltransferase [Stella sp.]|uniref:GNAT family N-acetyltransferase n=1 Tax=Stella sp. TaxID=2912054 RepID=UPI0035B43D17
MEAQPELTTPRLRLRARTLADVEAIMAMDADPEVRRYLGPVDPDEHRAHVTRRIVDRVPDIWAVERRTAPGLIGLCSIAPRPDGKGKQINWRLARSAWGWGLATEAAAAVLRHALADPAAYGPLVAIIHPDNAASIAVARRLGMQPVGEGHFYGGHRILYGLAPDP